MIATGSGEAPRDLTIDEAVEALGVGRRTVFKALSEGRLRRSYRASDGRTVVSAEDVERLRRELADGQR